MPRLCAFLVLAGLAATALAAGRAPRRAVSYPMDGFTPPDDRARLVIPAAPFTLH